MTAATARDGAVVQTREAMTAETFTEVLLRRAEDDHPGLLFEERSWSWREVIVECVARAHVLCGLRRGEAPLHVGVLLENVPEYLFLIGGAAFAGATLVGLNSTRRGDGLGTDARRTDCDLILTDGAGLRLLEGVDTGVDPDRVLLVDDARWSARVDAHRGAARPTVPAAGDPASLLLLLFTSGSTGAPKAVRCTSGRLAMLAAANTCGFTPEDVTYNAMPLFHGNAIMACWAPSVYAGATHAMRRRFSASGFLPDVRRVGATFVNYVGRSLAYILSVPESADERDTALRTVFGTEAAARDRDEFARRFGVRPVESYGSSEGAIVIHLTEEAPPNSLGRPPAFIDAQVWDATGAECPRAQFGDDGRLRNPEEAIGEIVNAAGAALFEGYYHDDEAGAQRIDGSAYRSGDLGYRDECGYFYFAGRSGDRLRVDGENFSAAPIERILARFPGVLLVAVFPVPDPRTGDQVMAVVQMQEGHRFDPGAFGEFLTAQRDLGTKWAPRFVRVVDAIPVTGTRKIDKQALRREGWQEPGQVFVRGGRQPDYAPLGDTTRRELLAEFDRYGRSPSA